MLTSDESRELLALRRQIEIYRNRMLTKEQTARRFGMTVSWLNNSRNETAVELRRMAVKMGSSPSSPVRYPLSEVAKLMQLKDGQPS